MMARLCKAHPQGPYTSQFMNVKYSNYANCCSCSSTFCVLGQPYTLRGQHYCVTVNEAWMPDLTSVRYMQLAARNLDVYSFIC
jgi:hypothetical protein